MSEVIHTILIMSISGSIIAALLFALKPLIRNRLPKSAQYYLWLVVIAALLLPVSKLIVLPENSVIPVAPIQSVVEQSVFVNTAVQMNPVPVTPADYGLTEGRTGESIAGPRLYDTMVTIFIFVYPFGAAVVLLYFLISYSVFTRLHRRRNQTADVDEIAILANLCGNNHAPLLYRNPLATTPMLFGLFRPAIILPDRDYTDEQLRAVLLHELTHLRRKDIFVKWLSVLSCAVHWFNPIVWLARREIDRACELACDEAVIFNYDAKGRQNYGETLIYVAADNKTPRAVLSTTMCEEKKALKERLGAIVKNKKHTRVAVIISVALIFAVSGTAIALGAGKAAVYKDSQVIIINDSTAEIFSIEVYYNNQTHSVSNADNTLIKKGEKVNFQLDITKGTVFQVSVTDADWNLIAQGVFAKHYDDTQIVLYICNDENGNTYIVDESLRDFTSLKTLYVGDNSAVGRIINILPPIGGQYTQRFFSIGDDYGTGKSPNTLTLYYERDGNVGDDFTITNQIPILLFAMIDNLEEVNIATRNSPSGNELDKTAYGIRYTYPKPVDTDVISEIGITWGDFQNDWENSFGRLYAQALMNNSYEQSNVKSFTLHDVRALGAKGDELLMEDFTKYDGKDVGSGLYILHFTIEGGYELLVGNGSTTGAPMYAMLSIPGFEENIDIRYEDIDEFISHYPVPNDVNNQVYRYLTIIISSPSLSSATGYYIKAHQEEYSALLDMGITALPALTGILDSGDRGLRGNVVCAAVIEIVERESSKPQSDWATGVLQNAGHSVDRWERSHYGTQSLTRNENPVIPLVEMIIDNITPSGLSFMFANESNEEYLYGSDYAVFVQANNSWIPVEPIIDNWGFTDEGYPLMPQSKTTVTTVDWRWLYGELTSGTYKFQKSMLFVRKPGDFDKYVLEQEFSLP